MDGDEALLESLDCLNCMWTSELQHCGGAGGWWISRTAWWGRHL